MKILALEKENPEYSREDMQMLFKGEAEAVWQMTQVGQIREIYFHAERHTAVIIMEAANSKEAEEILSRLPLVREGCIHFEIIPLAPYDGFARLFA